ncbi:MAG TPA: TlyA family RNA methyltransferase [Syntrophales bacterium]|nr:TlyA family RNA methyltransferase [Syntrophales bacterium]
MVGKNPKIRPKIRLDRLLVERGIAPSRERARALILAGDVFVLGEKVDKAGALVDPGAEIVLRGEDNPYVSRGGIKLKGALEFFGIRVEGMTALDVGASTGGFTDCLLQEGARKVYAIDVGYGQLAWKLRTDPRVVSIERTNIRFYTGRDIPEKVDVAAIDVSFISLRLAVPPVLQLLRDGGILLALVKPQFEAGREEVGRKGVVRDPEIHRKVLKEISGFIETSGMKIAGTCESPLTGPAGNREFFIYAVKQA